jgi:hypothetical protein
MRISELRDALELLDGDMEVRLATQPSWPLQSHIEDDVRVVRGIAYIREAGQVYDAPYAPVGLNADQSLVTRRRSPIMTTVTMHVLPDNRKTTITIPSEAWAHMTRQSEAIKTGGITRTVTEAHDGTHVVVDVHDGGTVVVWVEVAQAPAAPACLG